MKTNDILVEVKEHGSIEVCRFAKAQYALRKQCLRLVKSGALASQTLETTFKYTLGTSARIT